MHHLDSPSIEQDTENEKMNKKTPIIVKLIYSLLRSKTET